MKHLKIKHYMLLLFREGTKWEQRGLLETKINLYEKYISDDKEYASLKANNQLKPNDNDEVTRKKIKNFIQQFTFVTGKNFLVATLLIGISAFILLFHNFFSKDTSTFKIVCS